MNFYSYPEIQKGLENILTSLSISFSDSYKSDTYAVFTDTENIEDKMKDLILALYEFGKEKKLKIEIKRESTWQYKYELIFTLEKDIRSPLKPIELTIYNPKLEEFLKLK